MPPRAARRKALSPRNAAVREDEKSSLEAKQPILRKSSRAKGKAATVAEAVSKEGVTQSKKPGARKRGKEASTRQVRWLKENAEMEVDEQKKTRKRKNKVTSSEGETTASNSDEVPTIPPSKRKKGGKSSDDTSGVEDTDRAVFHPKPPVAPASSITHPSHRKAPGRVMVLGQGDMGQLGLGEDVMERKKPSPVGGDLEGKSVIQVICGGMHTVALTEDGKVYTWGCNDEGALGRLTEEGEEYIPRAVEKLENVTVVQISAGDSHTVALANNGNVYCWGIFRDSCGPFGLIKKGPSIYPELVYSSSFNKAIKVASGSDHVVILTDQGDVLTFGCGEQGQLGRVPECFSARGGRKGVGMLLHPQVVRFRKVRGCPKLRFNDVFCGTYHTFALSQDKGVYVWGLNNYGQLGTDDDQTRFQPELLKKSWEKDDGEGTDAGGQHTEICGGQHHTVLCHNGSVYVMGRKEYGRLGLGPNSEEPQEPKEVPELANVRSVAAGTACSFAVTEKGEAYAWGMGTNLQLGTGEEEDSWTPVKITGKKIENCRVIDASAGGQHTALLVSNQEQPME